MTKKLEILGCALAIGTLALSGCATDSTEGVRSSLAALCDPSECDADPNPPVCEDGTTPDSACGQVEDGDPCTLVYEDCAGSSESEGDEAPAVDNDGDGDEAPAPGGDDDVEEPAPTDNADGADEADAPGGSDEGESSSSSSSETE